MSILARADFGALSALWEALPTKPAWTMIRQPEIGMVMTRGRIGGIGNRFNLGEMTVTRCAVQLEDGTVGLSYVAGRDKRHAEIAAVVDALSQLPGWEKSLEHAVIAPLERQMRDKREARSRKAAATKVEFFTMVRGD